MVLLPVGFTNSQLIVQRKKKKNKQHFFWELKNNISCGSVRQRLRRPKAMWDGGLMAASGRTQSRSVNRRVETASQPDRQHSRSRGGMGECRTDEMSQTHRNGFISTPATRHLPRGWAADTPLPPALPFPLFLLDSLPFFNRKFLSGHEVLHS